jgi:flagellar motility protein MotE (MotC chaperone)
MAKANVIQDGIDRFQTAFDSLEKDFKRMQKNAEKRRKGFERETEKRVKKLRTELKKSPAVKRANQLSDNVAKAIEGSVDQVLGNLRIASSGEVRKLERKVASLNRKVRELEKTKKPATR